VSPFKQEIFKILLDKLLLGLIAAGFGFYLSRLLEDYRTRNTYFLTVYKDRADGLRKVVEIVAEHYYGISTILRSIQLAREGRKVDEEHRDALKFIERNKSFGSRLGPLMGFMSIELMDMYLAYKAETDKVAEVLNREGALAELPDHEIITNLFAAFHHACLMAITSPPEFIRQ